MNPRFSLLVLPFTRAEIPKWPDLMNAVSADWDTCFKKAECTVTARPSTPRMSLARAMWIGD